MTRTTTAPDRRGIVRATFTACALAGLGTSCLVLLFGHHVLTNSADLVAWCALELAILRALLRRDGRWWIVAGTVGGLAMYAKDIVLLLPVSPLSHQGRRARRSTTRRPSFDDRHLRHAGELVEVRESALAPHRCACRRARRGRPSGRRCGHRRGRTPERPRPA
ncbi:glycosyltransferase family 39 protein [Streptomyces sp. NPDC058409]|uniref:glycosyltransferase family 39 protein n=1 Tax=Streptomyces sp. NPDC058409 TaxID=3346484 RepID=UPI00364FD153